MKHMLRRVKDIRSLAEAIDFFWDYVIPLIVAFAIGWVGYWTLDRQPARDFIQDPQGRFGYIEPAPVIAGIPSTIYWYVQWNRNCDQVELMQEVTIDTGTSTPQIRRLERIRVRSRANTTWFSAPPAEWIKREFLIPASDNICTKERCATVKAKYRATLTDYCNPVHKYLWPVESESPYVEFMLAPSNPIGLQGATGATGQQGSTGEQGPAGPTGGQPK